jgi:hypothetical protein
MNLMGQLNDFRIYQKVRDLNDNGSLPFTLRYKNPRKTQLTYNMQEKN